MLRRSHMSPLLDRLRRLLGIYCAIYCDRRYNRKQHPNSSPEEREAVLPGIESVHALERVRVGGKESEQYAKGEGCVKAEEDDDWLGGQHDQGPGDGDSDQDLELGEGAHGRDRRRRDVQLFGAALQEDLLVGLMHGQDGDIRGERDEDRAPLGPAPAFELRGEAADYGTWLMLVSGYQVILVRLQLTQ